MSIATLKNLLDSGARTASAACRCGRVETLDLPALAAAQGADTTFVELRGRLKCRGCGARGQVTTTVEYPMQSSIGVVSNHGGAR
jgi:hypothetical protein